MVYQKATKDLLDKNGVLLVAKGTVITPEVITAIERRDYRLGDLLGPVDETVDNVSQNLTMRLQLDYSAATRACSTVKRRINWVLSPQSVLQIYVMTLMEQVGWVYTHSINVALLVALTAEQLGLDSDLTNKLVLGAVFHDIGLLCLPPGKQCQDYDDPIFRHHPVMGQNMLSRAELPPEVALIAAQHHERCNGSGFPAAARGPDIWFGSQVVMIADYFDSISTYGFNKDAVDSSEAIRRIADNKDDQFSVVLVGKFLAALSGKSV